MSNNKKIGRPTDSIKNYDIRVRVNEQTYKILNDYCNKHSKNKAEAIRDGIYKLEKDLKE